MKKIIAVVVCVVAVIAMFFLFNGGKKQIIGTWYYEKDPDKSITIYENNEAVEKGVGLGSEFYDYTYKDNILTLYQYGFKEHAYVVKVRGDKMYLTSGDDTDVYYKYYEEEDEKEWEEEAEDDIPLDIMASLQQTEEFRQNIPTEKDAELYLEEKGYYDYLFCLKDEYFDNLELYENIYYPTVVFYYDIYIGDVKHKAYIVYYYDNFEWALYKDIVFDSYFLGYD